MDNDPLADMEPCRCGGTGMITIGEHAVQEEIERLVATANAHKAELGRLEVEGVEIPDEGYDVWLKQRAAAMRNTVYPCRACRPSAFFRWAKGCGTPGHNAQACELCQRAERPTVRRKVRR